jgi:sugar lactone lactonase YvrE
MTVRVIDVKEAIGSVVSEVGEGPIWDGRFDVLRWVDINKGFVHTFSPEAGPLDRFELGQDVGFVVPLGSTQLLAGVRQGFAVLDGDGSLQVVVPIARGLPHMRLNDGKADPAGRVWAGTMGIEDPGSDGSLYCLGRDWSLQLRLQSLTIPNGIGWSPDGATMYFTDTTWGRVDAFDYELTTGTMGQRRSFVTLPASSGMPDGLTVDEEGCIWLALWGGGAVHRYTPDGRLDTVLRVPAAQVTSCVFGGRDHRELFITSASLNLTSKEKDDYPRAGSVFVCQPGVKGLRTDPYMPDTAVPLRA